ncbi:MAG: CotH kinase family protein [Verrucomicrobia bacterium]|nr:CotH kinase family protein [Verrucomicrobiota bacterium]MBI3867485.1 CotH kinase family protein [Verrucomicrobiota bacterium]
MKDLWMSGRRAGRRAAAQALLGVWMLAWTAGAAVPVDDSDTLFTNAVVRPINIEIGDAGMKTLQAYHQVWGQPRPKRIDVKATIREGNRVYTNVSIHLKGSYTYQSVDQKPSLTVNFDKLAPGQRFHGLDKIHLNNSVQDPTYLCEKLARELFAQAGVPASRVGHARVQLNGRDLGLYILVEGYNKRFLKRHFSSVRGNLYDGGSGGDVTKALEVDSGEDPENRADLTNLVAAVREKGVAARMAKVEQSLDVPSFLTFAALEVILQHWDGYCLGPNNYRLFHDADRDKMVFMPHGLDQILGVGLSPPASLTPAFKGVVARGVIGTPEGRRRYLSTVEHVFTNHCDEARLIAKVERVSQGILSSGELGFLERLRFQAVVRQLKSRIHRRLTDVAQQLAAVTKPLAFEGTTPLAIQTWKFKQPSRGETEGIQTNGRDRDTLEVRHTSGEWASGSWRRSVLLEGGRYELSGLCRVDGLPPGATNSGVILRISGEREPTGLSTNTAWSPQRYEFDVPGPLDVELICEFRGPAGAGLFDLTTLKLRRLGSSPKTTPER